MSKIKPLTIHRPGSRQDVSPVVFDTPHSGTVLPDHFTYECRREQLDYLLDKYMDRLLTGLPARGFPVLETHIHRACIDMNRFDDEMDPKDIKGKWEGRFRRSVNTKGGFGLVARECRVKGTLTRIYNEHAKPTQAEIQKRIELYLRPYHKALFGLLDDAHKEHGFCVHINMHSMVRRADPPTADFVLGDLRGKACAPEIRKFARDFFKREGYTVSMNAPYAGGALVKQTAAPELGRHALQIEIARDLYMNPYELTFHPEKAQKIRKTLENFAVELEKFCLANEAKLKPDAASGRKPGIIPENTGP